jgi:hypothetical protein
MKFDRDTLKKFTFSKNNTINIACGTCHKGILIPDNNKYIKEKTASVKASEREEYYSSYDYEAKACYLLMCNNPKCKEPYLVVGIVFEDIDYVYDHRSGEDNETEITTFKPLFFTPVVHVFDLHKSVPKLVADEMIKSFGLFFNDLSSAANKIRIAVELLLNEFGIAASVYMDRRIKEFKKIQPDVADKLSATKIIGNSGSHVAEISRDDVIDAYEMMEFVFDELFTRKVRKVEVESIASKIVAKETQRKKK